MKQQGRGRARKPEARKPGERSTLNMRIASDVWLQLDQAAVRSGRSLSQEAELRISQSFRDEGLLPQALTLACGSRRAAGLVLLLVRVISREGRLQMVEKGEADRVDDWPSDPWPYSMVEAAAAQALEAFRPEGEPQIANDRRAHAESLASTAKMITEAIKDPDWGTQFGPESRSLELEHQAAEIRNLLFPKAEAQS